MEALLVKYNVDVAIWAHEHYYERFWPLNDYRVMNGSRSEPYTNAKVKLKVLATTSKFLRQLFTQAPIHLVTGSAGCDEGKEDFVQDRPYYSAFRSNDYGYTR